MDEFNEFPKMLYRGDDRAEQRIADDAEQEAELRADGFDDFTPQDKPAPRTRKAKE